MATALRLCIVGPSGVGKTTLAAVLARMTGIPAVFGDAFIKEAETDLDGLREALAAQQWIFEHVAGLRLLETLRLVPSHVVFLRPQQSRAQQLDSASARDSPAPREEVPRATYGTIREALPRLVDLLHTIGIFPPSVRTYVVKIASRCNLNCSYCYMYAGGLDTNWRAEPPFMTPPTASAVAARIAEYAVDYPNSQFTIVFHGGEPLTVPATAFGELAAAFQERLHSHRGVRYGVQTNGTLLSEAYLAELDRLGFGIGISLDGSDELSNADRVGFAGESAFTRIVRGLDLAIASAKNERSKPGVLCVINPLSNGGEVYRYFRAKGVDRIDFLLRDRTWRDPPKAEEIEGNNQFLKSAFDAWLDDPAPCSVPYFSGVLAGLLAVPESVDTLSLLPPSTLAVSASGKWESLDVLRVTYETAWQTPYNVFDHSVRTVIASTSFKAFVQDKYDLDDKCLSCRHLLVCGGGHISHRYSVERRFQNPSVHCGSILPFIDYVKNRLLLESSSI